MESPTRMLLVAAVVAGAIVVAVGLEVVMGEAMGEVEVVMGAMEVAQAVIALAMVVEEEMVAEKSDAIPRGGNDIAAACVNRRAWRRQSVLTK